MCAHSRENWDYLFVTAQPQELAHAQCFAMVPLSEGICYVI